MQKYKISFKGQNIYVGIDARSEVFDFFVKRSITCPHGYPVGKLKLFFSGLYFSYLLNEKLKIVAEKFGW